MIKVENIEVWGFEHAVRGMRNPLRCSTFQWFSQNKLYFPQADVPRKNLQW